MYLLVEPIFGDAMDTKDSKNYLYRAIIEKIRDMVKNGGLKPGNKLPPERKLAEELGVSRNSLRQALQALSERGLVESRQGDGNYLSVAFDSSFFSDAIVDTITEQRDFLKDIIEFRLLMEPKIASLAAARINKEQIDCLKVLVCDQHRAVIDGDDVERIDTFFHQRLAEFAGNRVIHQVMSAVRGIINETRSGWLQSKERRLSSVEGHLSIIKALESGDPDQAYDAMKNHLLDVEQHILGD